MSAADRQHGGLLDLASAAVALALVGWVTAGAPVASGRAAGTRDILLLIVSVYAASRLITVLHPWAVPALVVLGAIGLAVVRADVLLSGPLRSPLGYSNATAALYVLASAAALLVAARADDTNVRALGLGAAGAAALVPWGIRAHTAAAMTLLPPLALVAPPLGTRVRTVVALSALVTAGAVAATVAIGLGYTGESRFDRVVAETLTERRALLWGDAIAIVREAPRRGVGTGRFAAVSSVARSDRDAAWAHNEFLELAAGTGLPGGLLALALVLLILARMALGPRDAGTAVAASCVAALCVLASVDYVLHFPAVAAAGAAVAGAGVAPAAAVREQRPVAGGWHTS